MTVWPDFRMAASDEDGFWTRRMTSAWAYISTVGTTFAPASA